MRELIIPGVVSISNVDYSVDCKFLQDDTISAIYQRYYNEQSHQAYITVDFRERAEYQATLEQAKNWILNTFITVNPFVFQDNQPYIGDDITSSTMHQICDTFNIAPVKLAASGDQPVTMKMLNGDYVSTHLTNTSSRINGNHAHVFYYGGWILGRADITASDTDGATVGIELDKVFFPTSSFAGGMFVDTSSKFYLARIQLGGVTAVLGSVASVLINTITITIWEHDASTMKNWTIYGDLLNVPFEDLAAEAQGFSGNDPYVISPSAVGGGYGSGVIRPSDPIPDPEAPEIDAVTTGLLTIFKPTISQVQALGDYLWSSAFDINTLKKLFGDPMEAIIGLSIVPINPPAAGSKNVKIGDVDTGISMPYISRQFVEKDLGSITIDPVIGSFMDYSQTRVSIYLPYVGFRTLDTADVMGTTLSIKYIIDVLTGGCNAVVNVSGKGAIYQFNGSCIANVPLSQINYSGAIQNAVSAIGSGITTAVGGATGNVAVTAMGVAGLAANAANTALNSKPDIQRSGSMGGAAGLCSVQFPYVVIERPRLSVPANYGNFYGNTLNVTMTLQECSGYTVVDEIHLDNVLCTENERDELMKLLKEGVIIHLPEPEPEPTPEET